MGHGDISRSPLAVIGIGDGYHETRFGRQPSPLVSSTGSDPQVPNQAERVVARQWEVHYFYEKTTTEFDKSMRMSSGRQSQRGLFVSWCAGGRTFLLTCTCADRASRMIPQTTTFNSTPLIWQVCKIWQECIVCCYDSCEHHLCPQTALALYGGRLCPTSCS